MKKLIIIALFMLMAFNFTACQNEENNISEENSSSVVETTSTPAPTKEPVATPEPTKEPVATPAPTKEPVKTPEPIKEPTPKPTLTPEPTKEPVESKPEPTPEPSKEETSKEELVWVDGYAVSDGVYDSYASAITAARKKMREGNGHNSFKVLEMGYGTPAGKYVETRYTIVWPD